MIWALTALAGPIRVAFLGSSAEAVDLASLLGDGYRVERFSRSQPRFDGFRYVILGDDFSAPPSGLDTFVPALKKRIETITRLPQHPQVLVRLPAPQSDFDRQVEIPLMIQAAREEDVKTFDSSDGSSVGYAESAFFQIVDWKTVKAGWRIVHADSEELDEGPAKNAIDGDPDTYWHTQYSPTTARYPHELIIDMGSPRFIGGFRYVPRQDGGVNGRVRKYEFEVSQDGANWGAPVAAGDFSNSALASTSLLKTALKARYVKFRALSEQTGGPYASVAELNVLPARFAASG